MFVVFRIVFLTALVSHSLGNRFNWTITHSGKQFVNIHLDPDHVSTPCSLENTICVPITFSVVYCNVLNSADSNIEVWVFLSFYDHKVIFLF